MNDDLGSDYVRKHAKKHQTLKKTWRKIQEKINSIQRSRSHDITMYGNVVSHEVDIWFLVSFPEHEDSQAFLTSTHCHVPIPNSYDGCPFVAVLPSILKGLRTSVPVQPLVAHLLSYCIVTIRSVGMQNIHITRSSERAEQAENVLKQAMNLLERHRSAIGSDNYNMARGWLTR